MDTYGSFVWEPSLVKTNAITAATEAACLVSYRLFPQVLGPSNVQCIVDACVWQ